MKALLTFPFALGRELLRGVGMGLDVCCPRETLPSYDELLAVQSALDRLDALVAEIRDLADSSAAPVTPPDAAAERPAGEIASADTPGAAPAGHPNLLRAAAHQLRDWAADAGCGAPHYCRSLSKQLEDAAEQIVHHK
ncbi:hypothetical protein [Mycobacterium branderi]|uniref:Uncharacterized protein n=1 Tax=Mycobacterium branderi TaxID=43348 RepID=A0A7I7W2B6_9MYCO|nr:hypothetical protein [Mycobacterium branderi]MCV7232799.1 hypothetical protein [Mycobacterium branderi]ORA40932.1 hypothetical protein BST20_01935 [Mycobacterium branderi]BBZ09828.1 hypothetical protein MBRA_00230 [Mycobacterium branderi]